MIARVAKKAIRSTVGLWPTLEFRNRLFNVGHDWRAKAFEKGEAAWPDAERGAVPYAPIACIIPTYKRHERLLSAITSALAQDRQDFLIVVVDDGGGLPTLPTDQRLFAVSLSKNTGIAGLVRNVGVRLCNSAYIAFLDDDNRWLPNHLSTTIGMLERGADFAYSGIRRLRPDGTELDVLAHPFDRRALADESCWLDINSVVIKRTAFLPFSRMPRPPGLFPREDWEFFWRVTKGANVSFDPTVTVEYLVNPKSYFTDWKPAA